MASELEEDDFLDLTDDEEVSEDMNNSNSIPASYFVKMGFDENLLTKIIRDIGESDSEEILNALLANSTSRPGASPFSYFVDMGFTDALVSEALEVNGEENMEAVLETLLTSSRLEGTFGEKRNIMLLKSMGFSEEDATVASTICGEHATIDVLKDTILAAQLAKGFESDWDVPQRDETPLKDLPKNKIGVHIQREALRKVKKVVKEDGFSSTPMMGFDLPKRKMKVHSQKQAVKKFKKETEEVEFSSSDARSNPMSRELPDAAIAPPFFYFDDKAVCRNNVQGSISQWLFSIKPELIDSKEFSAIAMTRGYLHNLPFIGRFHLHPPAPLRIQDAIPQSKTWWPNWDIRTKFTNVDWWVPDRRAINKIQSSISSDASRDIQNSTIIALQKWNLVWVGALKLSTLEPDEIEMFMGYPRGFTRGGGFSASKRYGSLRNEFQVHTLAYHMSPLKSIFPNGIRVLSLLSGIGGAIIALHRLQIPLKLVVLVEQSEDKRDIVKSWWKENDQEGTLIGMADSGELSYQRLHELRTTHGGFDLVIGGDPGDQSALVSDCFRVLVDVMRLAKIS